MCRTASHVAIGLFVPAAMVISAPAGDLVVLLLG